MNKTEMIDAIAKKASLTKVDAKKFLNAFVDVTSTSLINGDKVILFGFGTFFLVNRVARTGRNPLTGARLNVPAKKVVKFKAGSALRTKIK
jgi:DNA-binding protein HU-beta